MKRLILLGCVLSTALFGVSRELDSPRIRLKVIPAKMEQGGAALLRVALMPEPAPGEVVEATIGDQKLPLWGCTHQKQPYWCTLIPVSLEQAPGPISISVLRKQGESKEFVITTLRVRERKVKESKLTVEPKIATPNEADAARMEQERKELEVIFSTSNPTPLWKSTFQLPGTGGVTSRFGNRRSFNGEVKSIHRGVDLKAKTGTPIYAANAGTVVAAKEFFLGGNMVVLDHGTGLFTGYAHLSRLDVKVGDKIDKGKQLGLSGATGRVTGPHLHWTFRASGHSLDPLAARDALRTVSPADVR